MRIRKPLHGVLLVLTISLSLLIGTSWTGRSAPDLQAKLLELGIPSFSYSNQVAPLGELGTEEQEELVKEYMENLWRYRADPDAPRPLLQSTNAQNGLLIFVDENGHLAQAKPDGSDSQTITTAIENVDSPQWSVDEQDIVFVGDKQDSTGRCIYTLGYDDKQLSTVNCEPSTIHNPYWSPDGQSLAFYGHLNEQDSKMQGWVVPAAGGNLMEIAPSLLGIWTPKWIDEDTVVFSGESPVDVWRIYRADIGTLDQPKPITPEFSCECTPESVVAAHPVLSPDRNWIAFVAARTESGKSSSVTVAAVYIVDPKGENEPLKLGDIADTTSGVGSYGHMYWAPNNWQIGALGSGSDQMMRLNFLRTDSDQVYTLRSREGGSWSNWDWSPDGLLIGTGHQRPDRPWEVNTVFVGSDSFQRLLNGHSPNWRNATTDQCAGADKSKRPLMLVTGWSGSERNSLDEDGQLGFFIDYLEAKGYKEGCNLFYAVGTTPYRSLNDNGRIIHDNLCSAYHNVKHFNPGWSGTFDLIGHSYGGLRARHFLENDDLYDGDRGADCGNNAVFVENLITLGTPHGGEPFVNEVQVREFLPLPFAGLIGLCAAQPVLCDKEAKDDIQYWALIEMVQATRLVENLLQSQPENTCYYLLAGDARGQMEKVPWILRQFIRNWPDVEEDPNDFAVHRDSSYVLGSGLLTWNYQRVNKIDTIDVHGYIPEDKLGDHDLISFVEPINTFESQIFPLIEKDCDDNETDKMVSVDTDMEALKRQLQTPVTTAAMPHRDIIFGVLAPDEPTTGQFEIFEEGESHVTLYWDHGDIEFELTDPLGSIISPDANYVELDTGFGLMADYRLPETLTGTWSYRLVVRDVEYPIAYRLLYQPGRPIGVNLTAPQWQRSGEPLLISATVVHNETLLPGGSVSTRIERPDASQEELTLFDDGAHQDGAAGDGVYANTYTNTEPGGFYGLLTTASGELESILYERTASALVTVAPATQLTQHFNDEPLDNDEDGYYEWLTFDAEIEVKEAGDYLLQAELWAGNRFITEAEGAASLAEGTHELRVLFEGNDIRQGGLNGPYTIRNLLLVDQTQAPILIDSLDDVHQTDSYNHRLFGIPFKVYAPVINRAK